jgi:hypothetical protein
MRRLIHKLLLILLIAMMSQGATARNYVLCVGLDTYPNKVGRYRVKSLHVSANDAKVMKKVFAANGFSTSVLTDSAATLDAVLRTMKYRFYTAKSDDMVVFYFSGHGTEDGLLCYDKVLDNHAIVEVLKKCKAKTKMVIVDACYSGIMRTDSVWHKAFGNEDVILFLSSRNQEESFETGYSNSLFTMYVERGLRGGADTNTDSKITPKELYEFVHKGVSNDGLFKERQHPVMWGRFDGDRPIIIWQNKKDKKSNKTNQEIEDATNN